MNHKDRRWCVAKVKSAERLAQFLRLRTWTLCTGFALENYLFLNDSLSEDAVQEYAIIKRPPRLAREPFRHLLSFEWLDYQTVLAYIELALHGELDDGGKIVNLVLQTAVQHRFCQHCRVTVA